MSSHPKYLRLLDHLRWLHVVKADGYGKEDDPLDNLKHSARFGVPPWKGALVRSEDKTNRWLNLDARNGDVTSHGDREGILDTGADKMAYDGLALVLWAEEHGVTDEEWEATFPVGDAAPGFYEMVALIDAFLQNYPSGTVVNSADPRADAAANFVHALEVACTELITALPAERTRSSTRSPAVCEDLFKGLDKNSRCIYTPGMKTNAGDWLLPADDAAEIAWAREWDEWDRAKVRVDEIWPGLYMGGFPETVVRRQLSALGIDHVISVSNDDPTTLFGTTPKVHHLPFEDSLSMQPPMQRIALLAFTAAEGLREGKTVYVHCAMGINRSALVVSHVLHFLTGWGGDRIIDWLRERRPEALHNSQFERIIRQLQEVEIA